MFPLRRNPTTFHKVVARLALLPAALLIQLLVAACAGSPGLSPTSPLPPVSVTASSISTPSTPVESFTPATAGPPQRVESSPSPPDSPSAASSSNPVPGTNLPATAGQAPRSFERIFTIVLENANYKEALAQPYLAQVARSGALLNNYFAVAHPSYPNYLALVAGSTFNIGDDAQVNLNAINLSDLLEAAGVSWKVYAEQFPASPCFRGAISGGYVRKHQPFLSFINVQNNPTRCAKNVPASQLPADVAAGNLPQYSLYIPDLNNDGHDTGVAFASKWLQAFLSPLLENPDFVRGTVIVVTFDEGEEAGSNQVYTALAGEPVKAGTVNDNHYNHYSLLRTIEDNFKLGNLGREDARATPITGIWKTIP